MLIIYLVPRVKGTLGYYIWTFIQELLSLLYVALQWGVMMGIDHERIHVETSSVLIRQLPVELVCCPKAWTGYAPSTKGTTLRPNLFNLIY